MCAAHGTALEPRTLRRIRVFVLVLVQLGVLGFLAELFLLEHVGSVTQWIPFGVLGAALIAGVLVGVRPTRAVVRVFQAVMIGTIVAGLLGLWLHYDGNVVFEREMDASAEGLTLVWHALRGATPALAPGALVQLGLLGLLHAYRHPALAPGAHGAPATEAYHHTGAPASADTQREGEGS